MVALIDGRGGMLDMLDEDSENTMVRRVAFGNVTTEMVVKKFPFPAVGFRWISYTWEFSSTHICLQNGI